MKVSVIVGSYRPGKCLYRCIKSLHQQTVLPDEIIIGMDEMILPWWLQEELKIPTCVVASGTTGVSSARNAACRKATGDILAFIDDDAVAYPNWIDRIQQSFEDPTVSCVGGPVIPQFEGSRIPEQWYWIIGCTGRSNRPICSNMAIRKKDFIEHGGFPEHLGRIKKNLNIGEETELVLNLELHKKNIAWDLGMEVKHWCPDHRTNWRYILSRAYKEGFGKRIIGKHYPLQKERQFLKYYLAHPDRYTIPVLCATGLGFILGG